jgi:hypothetical protein
MTPREVDTQTVDPNPEGFDDFVDVVRDAMETATGSRDSWRVDPASDAIGTWIYVDKDRSLIPSKGWKLHVSATPWSADDVLARTLPILFSENACFKFAASIDVLASINEGNGGLGQIGKFMTIYPISDEQAVSLAARIHEATRNLPGPQVLTDEPLGDGSLVHYRFDDFVGELEAPPEEGERFATDGVTPAPTTPDPAAPVDPFVAAGIAEPSQRRLIGDRYLITATLYRSPRGSVHLAADLIEPGTKVLKRAARWARALPDGTDARDLLRLEAESLESLSEDRHFPDVDGLIEQGDLYLAMEHVDGPTLARFVRERSERGDPLSLTEISSLGREIARAVEAMHSKGLVYRDLNPENVIVVANGEPRLIDLETASRSGSVSALFAAGSPGYASPQQMEGAPADPADDVYALGALLVFVATGHEPSEDVRLDGVDAGLVALIEGCLDPHSERRPSITDVQTVLAEIDAGAA